MFFIICDYCIGGQDLHLSCELEQPSPEYWADLYLDGGNAFFARSDHLGVFTEFVVHHTDQLIVEFQNNVRLLAAVHFEHLLGAAVDAVSQRQRVFCDCLVDDLNAFHSVHAVVCSAVVSGTIYH